MLVFLLSIEMHNYLWSLALVFPSILGLHFLWDHNVVRSNKNTITAFYWNFCNPLVETVKLYTVRIWCMYIKFIKKVHANILFIFDGNILTTHYLCMDTVKCMLWNFMYSYCLCMSVCVTVYVLFDCIIWKKWKCSYAMWLFMRYFCITSQ